MFTLHWYGFMAKKDIDYSNLTVTGAHKAVVEESSSFTVEDDVIIIVTQAYGPNGDSLMSNEVMFDEYPSITVLVRALGKEGLVHLSPFHGDRRKVGFVDIPVGTKCELLCPVSRKPLDLVGSVEQNNNAEFFAVYLTSRLSDGDMVAISNVWGDYNSRLLDNFELISMWAASESM